MTWYFKGHIFSIYIGHPIILPSYFTSLDRYKQGEYQSPFGGLTPFWWSSAWMIYLFYLTNRTHFSFIEDYVFLRKKCILFTTGASTLADIWLQVLQNKTIIEKYYATIFALCALIKRCRNEMHPRICV